MFWLSSFLESSECSSCQRSGRKIRFLAMCFFRNTLVFIKRVVFTNLSVSLSRSGFFDLLSSHPSAFWMCHRREEKERGAMSTVEHVLFEKSF